jgi:hypothetical protein
MEWDKIFAINKKIIDPEAARFTAISKEKICSLTLVNGPELQAISVPVHPQNPN